MKKLCLCRKYFVDVLGTLKMHIQHNQVPKILVGFEGNVEKDCDISKLKTPFLNAGRQAATHRSPHSPRKEGEQ